jgi:hypothetical protein
VRAQLPTEEDLGGLETGLDEAWAGATGGELFVSLTESSSTWYRYSPVLYEVNLDGTSKRLFGPSPQDLNLGISPVTETTSGREIFDIGEARSGCQYYPVIEAHALANGKWVQVPTGLASGGGAGTLSTGAEGDIYASVEPLAWPFPAGSPDYCTPRPYGPFTLYRLTGTHWARTGLRGLFDSPPAASATGRLAWVPDHIVDGSLGSEDRIYLEGDKKPITRSGIRGPTWQP